MEGLEVVFTIANKLGGVSFATLLIVILWGSYRGVWYWGKDVSRMEAIHAETIDAIEKDHAIKLAELKEDRDWWRNGLVTATGILEKGIALRERQERSKIDKANRELDRS